MKTIDNDIKMGQLKNVYLLYGTEDYLKRQYRDKLKHALVEPDDTMNFSAYEGKDINPKELIDLSETLPFFKEKRMILVENSGFFKNSCDDLAEYMSQVPESTCFVFVEEEVDKRSKLFKAASRAGSAVEFETPKEDMLIRWILGRIQREGKKITQSVMQLFLSKTGSDMENIDKELEKLICYTLDKTEISAADVEACLLYTSLPVPSFRYCRTKGTAVMSLHIRPILRITLTTNQRRICRTVPSIGSATITKPSYQGMTLLRSRD